MYCPYAASIFWQLRAEETALSFYLKYHDYNRAEIDQIDNQTTLIGFIPKG